MELERLPFDLTVCKLISMEDFDPSAEFFFFGKTGEELSLVCRTEDVPVRTQAREDGWKGFRIRGILDFSLIGILAGITDVLARNRIGLFAVSTYNTDYILVREEDFDRAGLVLSEAGYAIAGPEEEAGKSG